jgi:tetratricopeptide (TPR) repeat protein
MYAFLILALCLPSTAAAGTRLDAWTGDVGEVQITDVVEVPLLTYRDAFPCVKVKFAADSEKEYLFRIDMGSNGIQIAPALVDELGLDKKTRNKNRWASFGRKGDKVKWKAGGKIETAGLDTVMVGGLTLNDVDVEVRAIDPDPTLSPSGVLGVGALGIPVALLPSAGVVRFAPVDKADALFGGLQGATVLPFPAVESRIVKSYMGKQFQRGWAGVVNAKVGGQDAALGITTAKPAGTLSSALPAGDAPTWRDGDVDVIWMDVTLGAVDLPEGWFRHQGLSLVPTEGWQGSIGYNVLREFDIAVDPAGARIAFAPTTTTRATPGAAVPLDTLAKTMAEAEKEPPKDEKAEKAAKKGKAASLDGKAVLLLAGGQPKDAVAAAQEATTLDPDPCPYWSHLGQALLMDARFAEAGVAFQMGLDRYAAWTGLPKEQRGEILAMDEEELESAPVQPQDLDACMDVAAWLAQTRIQEGRPLDVAPLYQAHADLDPALPLQAGIALIRSGSFDAAQGPLRRSLNLAAPAGAVEMTSGARLALATVYEHIGDATSALELWTRESGTLAYDPLATAFYGRQLEASKGLQGATDGLLALTRVFPDSAAARLALADLQARQGQTDRAAASRQEARDLLLKETRFQPDVPAAWAMLAWTEAAAGRMDEARKAADAALRLRPSMEYAWAALARVEAAAGNRTAATKAWENARAFGSSNALFSSLEKPVPPEAPAPVAPPPAEPAKGAKKGK